MAINSCRISLFSAWDDRCEAALVAGRPGGVGPCSFIWVIIKTTCICFKRYS